MENPRPNVRFIPVKFYLLDNSRWRAGFFPDEPSLLEFIVSGVKYGGNIVPKELVLRVQCGLNEKSRSISQHTNVLKALTLSQLLQPSNLDSFKKTLQTELILIFGRSIPEKTYKWIPTPVPGKTGVVKKSPWKTDTDQPVNPHPQPANKCGFSYTSWKKHKGIIAYLGCFCLKNIQLRALQHFLILDFTPVHV